VQRAQCTRQCTDSAGTLRSLPHKRCQGLDVCSRLHDNGRAVLQRRAAPTHARRRRCARLAEQEESVRRGGLLVRVQEEEGQRAGAVHRQAAVVDPGRRLRGRRVGGLALLVAAWLSVRIRARLGRPRCDIMSACMLRVQPKQARAATLLPVPRPHTSKACAAYPVSLSCSEKHVLRRISGTLALSAQGRLSVTWPAQRTFTSCSTTPGAPSPSPPQSSCQPAAAAGVSASSNTGGGVRQGVFAVAGTPAAAPRAVGVCSALQACRVQQLWTSVLPCMSTEGGACGDAACKCSAHMPRVHDEATPCVSTNRAEAGQHGGSWPKNAAVWHCREPLNQPRHQRTGRT